MAENSQEPAARSTASPRADVPVFNCHVFLSPPNERGLITARVATLAGVAGQGHGEREALRSVVAQFKAAVGGYLTRCEAIPWLDPPLAPQPGETQRYVPVHF